MRDEQAVRQQVERLRAWLDEARLPTAPSMPGGPLHATLEQLEAAIEALSVTEAELLARNDALVKANEALSAERQRFESLFENAPDAYVVTDRSGVVLDANRAAAQLFGMSQEHLTGKPLALYVPAEDQGSLSSALLTASRADARPVARELRLQVRGGAVRHVAVSCAPEPPGEVRWLLRDVTDAKRADDAEARLRHEQAVRLATETAERQARFLADAGRELAATLDEAGVARTAATLAVPGLGALCLIDVATGDGPLRRLTAAYAGSGPEEHAVRIRTCGPRAPGAVVTAIRSGHAEVLLQLDASTRDQLADGAGDAIERLGLDTAIILPLRGRREVIGALTLLAVDAARSSASQLLLAEAFADRVALALESARLLREAEESSRAKSDFISVMSHEFRTPLTSIVGYADLLDTGTAGELSDAQRRHVDRLRAAAWHLTQLVDDILVFARGDRVTPVQRSRFDLRALIEEAAAGLQPVAAAAGLRLLVEESPPIEVHSDAGKLRQIVINLLGNAIKFTREGEIRVRAWIGEGCMAIAVQDTGVGIRPEHHERVFEPFFQADQGETRAAGGTGLGLAVTRELARLLGGDVSLESAVGQGSRFTVRLPLE